MKIGELARRTGLSERMLRYYEDEGLLKPDRTAAGYRDYSEADVAVVERIALLNGAGLRLKSIVGLLRCAMPGAGEQPCPALRDSVLAKMDELDRQIADLKTCRRILAAIVKPEGEPHR
ncbi:MerR family transcriptional regulator [Paenirhodobacter sp.]|uniref:MerR family transcriptional regulator n=1 Tax=Paenirhodobacter sp. TaxID=1965326 RepID=UPI003B3C3A6A